MHEIIASAREPGLTIGVVSNNSPHGVSAYLDRHGLSDGICLGVARSSYDPPEHQDLARLMLMVRWLSARLAATLATMLWSKHSRVVRGLINRHGGTGG